MKKAFVALGSNLEDPIKQVNLAIERLANISQIRLIKSSSLYQTSPWGKTDQADFINAVVKISTALTAHELLFQLREIEKKQGKNTLEKWGPRTIDCDLILYENEIIHTPELILPHPRMKLRGFVMIPLAEIEPTLTLPCGEKISDVLRQCDCVGIKKLC